MGWQAGGRKLGQQAVEELGVNLVLMGGRSQLRRVCGEMRWMGRLY